MKQNNIIADANSILVVARDAKDNNHPIEDFTALQLLAHTLQMELGASIDHNFSTDFTKYLSIGFLKANCMVPISKLDQPPFIAINNPLNIQALDDLKRLLDIEDTPVILFPSQPILSAINHAYNMTQESVEDAIMEIEEDPEKLYSQIQQIGDILDDTSSSPVIRLVNLMFSQAVKDGASDIHIEPYQASLNVRQRLDGILHDMMQPPKHVQASLVSRIKIMAKLDIAEKRLPQDGRIELKIGDKELDIRVSTLPTAFGERVVLRLLDKSTVILPLTDIGLSGSRLELFKNEIEASNGIILVTGPTGSGKTTTLYAALSLINSTDINILTIEDPIEYRIDGIGQVQINPKINLTFASGLRSIVRQDPDILLVGEIRDKETADIAIQSALTGHLVFSTLHTNNSASAITRLHDMGVEPFLISSSIKAVLAQRLVRVICHKCKQPYSPTKEERDKIHLSEQEYQGQVFYRGKGCVHCRNTGYKGRTGVFELLPMTEKMKKLVLNTSDANTIIDYAIRQEGLTTLHKDGARKILEGITTVEEVYRVCHI